MAPRLEAGDPFPDIAVESRDGPVRLSERWKEHTLVLAFMRHFG